MNCKTKHQTIQSAGLKKLLKFSVVMHILTIYAPMIYTASCIMFWIVNIIKINDIFIFCLSVAKLMTSSFSVYLLQRPRPASTTDSLARSRVVGRPAGQTARQRGRRPTGRLEAETRAPMYQNVIKTVSFFNNKDFKSFIILVLKPFRNCRALSYVIEY